MRADMGKVVTERPRAGGGIKAPKGEKKRLRYEILNECEQKRESIRRKWIENWHDGKQFTDVLGPIRGYLAKQVGRPWNKVWSEVCQHLPASNTNLSHIRDHVLQFVTVNVVMVDGKPYHSDGVHPIEGYLTQDTFYVHPVNGLLRKAPRYKMTRHRKRRRWGVPVPGKPMQQYHRIDGIWYLLTLQEAELVPNEKPTGPYRYFGHWEAFVTRYLVYDVGYKCSLARPDRQDIYGKDVVCVHKKQLSTREIKRASL